ncbi:MAG TPA: UDP-N-acetylmuramate dehydrogenase [Blastocatellia bacterium]|nr:UDP-N-acetylmuramate dehydrogenase [Blastocatellia bacterium]
MNSSPMSVAEIIRERVRLGPYTTLGIGGPARFFVDAFSEDDVPGAAAWAADRSMPMFVLGGGSNVLVADEGFPGLVLRVAIKGISSEVEDDKVLVTAGAGEDWDRFVAWCVERDLAGVECLSGIPGFVGGTPVQNVGAYGQEVSETIVAVQVYDRRERQVFTLINSACNFGYRSSIFNTTARDRYIVLGVTYALRPRGEPSLRYPDVKNFFAGRTDNPSLKEVREAVREIRARKAMLITPGDEDCKSAGSFFKNPVVAAEKFRQIEEAARRHKLIGADEKVPRFEAPGRKVKVPAAWLIEKAGFRKGHQKGRVGISSKHTLAIINRGGATASEVLALMREIQERVNERFGVLLVPEPVFVSADGW